MEIRTSSFNFARSREDGAQSASQIVAFPREVTAATVGIIGYSATFEDEDHHVGRLIVETSARIDPADATQVIVNGTFALRDWSNEFDDPFSGNVQWALLAELVPVTAPGPGDARGDLIITGAEVTQCIQHFRSAQHLDAANVFPDNSIRLVGRKPTIVRLYVDYDASSGLANIPLLSGELIVTSGGSPTTLAPLQAITPRRDVSTERGFVSHTLNFLIPESLCRGAVSLEARVFDQADNSQFSGTLSRSLTFESMPELPVMAVGINYTGDDVRDGAAPDELDAPEFADFQDLFDFTETIFPIPQVTINSYQTMNYDEDVKSDISEGCDKIGDLKDDVADLRGDSDDIVYGLFNSGLDTGSVGGCGGGGVAVGRIGSQGTAAHELGHALGRDHAPCDNVTRCAEPKNEDDDYPVYSGYDSDSIGEFGFDPRAAFGMVIDPATAHDMMGYSGNRWISPYNYKALMSRIPADFGAGASAAALLAGTGFGSSANEFVALPPGFSTARGPDGEWIRVKTPQLFLRCDINRDRSVRWQTAFHFDALPRPRTGKRTDFVLEQQDREGNVLRSSCLNAETTCCGSGCGCDCDGCDCRTWPVRVRHAVAFEPDAKVLVLYDCDKEIGRWKVPPPPKVDVRCYGHDDESTHLALEWKASVPGGGDAELWFLVQWRDRFGTWRGCAPRTRETKMKVPKRLVGTAATARLRVLASSGIATGVGEWQGDCTPEPPEREGEPPVVVTLRGVPAGNACVDLPTFVQATVVRDRLRTAARADLRWYDDNGAEIGRGRSLDLRALKRGQTLVTAAVLDKGEGSGEGRWLIERRANDTFRLLRGTLDDRSRRRKAADCADGKDDHDDGDRNDDGHDHDHDHGGGGGDDHDHDHDDHQE